SVPTWTGLERLAVVPSPSCPDSLLPQAQRVPSVLTATVWPLPLATATQTVLVAPTSVGAARPTNGPAPSWPNPVAPPPYNHGAGGVGVTALDAAEESPVPSALEAWTRNS